VAYVTVHKDLANIKAKVLFGLTGRQIVCFGAAVAIGVPLFFLLRTAVSASTATVWMVLALLLLPYTPTTLPKHKNG